MVETIKVFMNKETLATLEDHFVDDEKKTLHRFFYEHLRELAKTSKVSDSLRSVTANIIKEGNVQQETFQFKDLDLMKYDLGSDPAWRPRNLDPNDTTVFEMKVGEKTHYHLVNYCKIYGVRIAKFNDSIPRIKRVEKGKEVEVPDPRFTQLEKATCFEQVIHQALSEPISRLLISEAQDLFDKEFDEIEKAEKEAISS